MKLKLMSAALAALTFAPSTALAYSYTVAPGDSLWKISRKFHTTVEMLKTANQLRGDLIYPGQVLVIPGLPDGGNNSPSPPPSFRDGVFPLPKGAYQPFSDNFGDTRTWNPGGPSVRRHEGVDIPAPIGTPVYAAEGGTVINKGWSEYGGWRITVRVDPSTVFYYAHLSRYAGGTDIGATIKKGQIIGYVGNTGYGPVGTSGKFPPHLHFGIYKTGGTSWQAIDPYPYLKWWESRR